METFEVDEMVTVINPNSPNFMKTGVVEYLTQYLHEEKPRYCVRFDDLKSGIPYFVDFEEKDIALATQQKPTHVPTNKDAIVDYFQKTMKAEVAPLVLVEEKQTDPTEGRKFDSDKTQYSLLPPKALREVSDVLTFGAKKYARNNWRYVDKAEERYLDAALRHIFDYNDGINIDPESGKHHLAHAICCLMFIIDLQAKEKKND